MTTMASSIRPKGTSTIPSAVLSHLSSTKLPNGPRIRRRVPSISKDISSAKNPIRTREAGSSRHTVSAQPRSCEPDSDEESEQDIKFINIPNHTERPDHTRPFEKVTIDPKEILAKSQESHFNQVYDIDIHGKGVTCIENLNKFVRVRVLDLSCNHISEICNLEQNPELRDLKLYDNAIKQIENLDSLKELCHLQLQHNQIKTLGRGLQTLRKLRVLRLDSNYIHNLDVREVAVCSQLTSLDLSNNKLDSISAVNSLPNLEELFVVNNRLRSITDLSRCKKLYEVDVSYNRITDLSGMKGVALLTILHASHNQISSFKSVGKLKGLQELNVCKNRLTETRHLYEFYPSLQILDISDNCLETWEVVLQLKNLEDLAELYIAGNPFGRDNGPKPHYFKEIQREIPSLDVLDGAVVKKAASKPGTPLMRPMSASAVVTARQVESQLKVMTGDLTAFETEFAMKFDALKQSFSVLPAEDPSRPGSTVMDSRPISKCGKRSRIKEAQEFAVAQDLHPMNSPSTNSSISQHNIHEEDDQEKIKDTSRGHVKDVQSLQGSATGQGHSGNKGTSGKNDRMSLSGKSRSSKSQRHNSAGSRSKTRK